MKRSDEENVGTPVNTELFEQALRSEEIFRGKIVHLFRDEVRLPNGSVATREVMRHPGAVCVVPLTSDNEVVMVRQFRYPFGMTLLEVPAGKLDPDEDPETCAARELREETGARAETLIPLGVFYPSVAVLDERIHMYLARELTFADAQPDEDEFLLVERIPLRKLIERVMAGEIRDGKTQAALLKSWVLLQREQRG